MTEMTDTARAMVAEGEAAARRLEAEAQAFLDAANRASEALMAARERCLAEARQVRLDAFNAAFAADRQEAVR